MAIVPLYEKPTFFELFVDDLNAYWPIQLEESRLRPALLVPAMANPEDLPTLAGQQRLLYAEECGSVA